MINEDGDDGIAVKSDAITANNDPSTSGIVVNGNSSSEDLGRHSNSTTTMHAENKSSAASKSNERDEKSLEKV